MRIRWAEVHAIDAHQSARFDPTYHTPPRLLGIMILDGAVVEISEKEFSMISTRIGTNLSDRLGFDN